MGKKETLKTKTHLNLTSIHIYICLIFLKYEGHILKVKRFLVCNCFTESSRLEETLTVILAQQSTQHPYPQVPHTVASWKLPEMVTPSPPWTLFQCLTALSVQKIFLVSNLNLPLCTLRPFPLVLSSETW